MPKNIDDYLNEGIYGAQQTKPDERRLFLGSLRERAVFVLTVEQIKQGVGVQELDDKLDSHRDAKLLLNGQILFDKLTPYRRLALKYDTDYTLVDEKSNQSAYGLVLCYDYAINHDEIFLNDKEPLIDDDTKEQVNHKRPLWKKLLGYED
ncbi:YueI family protein [Amphibacillus jilinensis]|uniref:YueI family protein n=1 Tax=Amphibacillus jilinensis TaxID=1216008 RepID=UPI0002F5C4A1|nr:YueI family protein [Amphibacillus jilinensis]